MEHHYLVTILDRVKSVGDRNTRLVLHHSIQRFMNDLFIGAVESWGGFVQEKKVRFSDDHTSDCYSLLLASWYMWTLDSNVLFEACSVFFFRFFGLLFLFFSFFLLFLFFGRFIHHLNCIFFRIEVRFISRIDYLITISVGAVVRDVVSYCFIEQNWFLTDHTQTCSKMMDIVIFDVDIVDEDLSLVGIVETLKKLVDCGFSAAWRTDKA